MADYGALAIEDGCISQFHHYQWLSPYSTPRPLAQGWTVIARGGWAAHLFATINPPIRHSPPRHTSRVELYFRHA
jgi:hypothetical protein